MKKNHLLLLVLSFCMFCTPVFSQSENDTTLLGLPGDNLDLYAVLDLFQKSKTIEDFEKTLNEEKTGINNLDLNLDSKVDFIKVKTQQKAKDFTFILQVDVKEKETQDVAVILVSKDKNDKVTMQIVGDKDLYGKDYVVEPKAAAPTTTHNPGYTGTQPATTTATTTNTTVVVVESAPIVQYVYSPVYVPYYPPYYYGYYPPYYVSFTVVSVNVYHHNTYYHHHAYYGGNNNTVIIHNQNTYNNYNVNRNTSNTVNQYNTNGNYNKNNVSNRPSTGTAATPNPSAPPSASPAKGASTSAKPTTTTPSGSQSKAAPATANPSTSKKTSTSKSRRAARNSGGSKSK
jgi:hypothetical protein